MADNWLRKTKQYTNPPENRLEEKCINKLIRRIVPNWPSLQEIDTNSSEK